MNGRYFALQRGPHAVRSEVMNTGLPIGTIQFCAEEVLRQGRGPIQVADMCRAWYFALAASWHEPYSAIQGCGHLVEPTRNAPTKWRDCGVRVGDHIAPRPSEVPELMSRYCDSLDSMTPDEAYLEFQHIHPFRDGNGRVGKILYNYKRGTLDAPQMPPNFFGCANP